MPSRDDSPQIPSINRANMAQGEMNMKTIIYLVLALALCGYGIGYVRDNINLHSLSADLKPHCSQSDCNELT